MNGIIGNNESNDGKVNAGMKVSRQWLSQYLDLSGYHAAELAEKLTRSGVEVEAVEARNAGVSGVLIGYVKTREKHPNADKLSVCTVDVGSGEALQIVCGAANVAAGQKVPVAVVGAILPGNFKIKRAKLRDVESQGMICSAKELGLNDKLLPKEQQEGILVLPADSPVGLAITEYLALDDEVLELSLTPNRSDCLSMLGVAYEVGAIIERQPQLPDCQQALLSLTAVERSAPELVSVKIDAAEACTLYTARVIEGVTIGTSPQWLQNRLLAAGIRPINNVVDVTNFVLLEFGQPLHAFDYDRLPHKEICVRYAKHGERLVTLDDQERELEPSMLVIADGEQAIALAGVMGGASSEVTHHTTNILLESAKFSGSVIRKTSKQLGLRSESSLRFEKEVNVEGVTAALDRAATLIAELAGGRIADGVVSAVTAEPQPVQIAITLQKINDYLGTVLTVADVEVIFARLQLSWQLIAEHQFVVDVPSRRGDLARDVDLIEEVARLYGYDRIPTSLVFGPTTVGTLTTEQTVRRLVRRRLTGMGLDEVINYSFSHPHQLANVPGFYAGRPAVTLALPMSEERSVLRQSLVPHLLDVVAFNRDHNRPDVAVFEIGHVFITDEAQLTKLPAEPLHLGLALSGQRQSAQWLQAARMTDFYDLKGIVERLLSSFGIREVTYRAIQAEGYHPGRTAEVCIQRNGETLKLGWFGQVHPGLQQQLGLGDTFVAEFDLNVLTAFADNDIGYEAVARFPESKRDLAIVVDKLLPSAQILDTIRQFGGELLKSIQVFDVYTGDKIATDKKSVAVSLVFRHDDRTLQDEEVQQSVDRIVQALADQIAAELRK